ncbi:hypothetical protein DSO57_1002907 [Entomophthora muscae]|uniref:Uncharacterized protein n=1 Tax=Entomophthora muscae TaxID=34485 RepID=A0ACC2SL98_9FUNG|nr:hypothetical protein DSO57_1002907 [Entomophthora muscae]
MNQFFKLAILVPGALCFFPNWLHKEDHARHHLLLRSDKNRNSGLTALQWVNCLRSQEGSKPLRVSVQLTKAAQMHSAYQSSQKSMTHIGSNNSTISERVKDQGYAFKAIAENIHHGFAHTKQIMLDFFNSTKHMDNLANPIYEDFGAAEDNSYVTHVFGTALTSDYPANPPSCPKKCPYIAFQSNHFKNKAL